MDATGFSTATATGENVFRIEWADVREIVAFKEDIFSYDEICVGFRVADEDTYWRVTEEFTGYTELLQELETRFPRIRTEWFKEVAFPAFVPNWTVLWGTPFPPEKRAAKNT